MGEYPTATISAGVLMISVNGRLDMLSAPKLRDQILALVQGGNTRLVLDLSAVELIDSAGLGALISGLKAARQANGRLEIAKPSKPVKAILKLTNLDRVFDTSGSEDGGSGDPQA